MAKHFKPYDFTLVPNGSAVIYAVGKYLKVLESTGTINVRVDGGSAVPMKAGQGLELEDGETWSEITITDTSGQANTGKIFIAAGRFTDQTFNGEVQVLGGNVALIGAADEAHAMASRVGVGFFQAAVMTASQQLCFHIWNPVGSGKSLILKRLRAVMPASVSSWSLAKLTNYTAVPAGPNVLVPVGLNTATTNLAARIKSQQPGGLTSGFVGAVANTIEFGDKPGVDMDLASMCVGLSPGEALGLVIANGAAPTPEIPTWFVSALEL